MKYSLVALFLCISLSSVYAQTEQKKSGNSRNREEFDRGATYQVESATQQKSNKKKKTKHSISKDYDKKVEEYEKRMVANAKKNERIAKEMKKPQYSDPSYFGHKKKPKKRPPGKKKYCKECEMTH